MVNIASQLVWVLLLAGSLTVFGFVFGTTDPRQLAGDRVEVPTIAVLLAATVVIVGGIYGFRITQKASVVRGRELAATGNVKLLKARGRVREDRRVVRATRFGSWPADEVMKQRSNFRTELDTAIVHERTEVRRIWNLRSPDDIHRLREILQRYDGCANHSIRVYIDLPYHSMPEILVVDHQGASLSFASTRNPHDWMMRFKRADLTGVVRDYFDVLWNHAEQVFEAGERTSECDRTLQEAEEHLLRMPDRPRKPAT